MKHFWCYLPKNNGIFHSYVTFYMFWKKNSDGKLLDGAEIFFFFFWMAVPFLGEMTWVGFTVMESLGFRLCWESWCYLSPGSLGSVPGGNQNPRRALACHQSQVFFGGSSDIVYCVAVLPDASWWLLRPCEMHGCHWIIVKRLFDCWNVQLILVAVMEGYDM